MILKKNMNQRTISGFSLLELLLAVGVIATLFTAASMIFDDWFKQSIDRKVSREMYQLQRAAAEYVRLNLDEIITNEIPDVFDAADLSKDSTEEIDINDLIAEGFLPVGYSRMNSFRQDLRVIMRHIADNTVNGDAVEVISFSEGRKITDKRLFNAASNGEKGLGVISNLNISASCCNGNIQSINGSWSVPLNQFSAAYRPTAPNATGGYMAAYNIVSTKNNLSNDFLFRDKVVGSPELNRMEANLDLNGNDITNAGVVVVDSMNVGGNAVFQGQEDGGVSPYVLMVEDDLAIGTNLIVTSNGDDSKGNVTINGDDNVGTDFTVTGLMDMPTTDPTLGNVKADSITANSLTRVGGLSRFTNLHNSGSNLVVNNIYSKEIRFKNTAITNNLQAAQTSSIGSLTADSAVVGTTTVTNGAGPALPSDIYVGNNATIRGNVSGKFIRASKKATINTLSACGAGCP